MKNAIRCLIISLVLVFFFSGCVKDQDAGDGNGGLKTVTMSVQELLEDRAVTSGVFGGLWRSKLDYKTLDEGDTLIIIDRISDIKPSSDGTSISFDVNYTYEPTNVTFNEIDFRFEDDLTDKYFIGDDVHITLTISRMNYTNETASLSFDFEVFEEGWNLTYFEKNYFFSTNFFQQIFPESVISKVD